MLLVLLRIIFLFGPVPHQPPQLSSRMGEGDHQDGAPKKEIKMNKVWGMLPLEDQVQAPIVKAMKVLKTLVDSPVEWIRGLL